MPYIINLHLRYITYITAQTCVAAVNSVMSHCSVASCVGSQAVPTIHVSPVLGLDHDAAQLDDVGDQQQVHVPCDCAPLYTVIHYRL